MVLDPRRFKQTVHGKPVRLYLLRNSSGMVVGVTNYGAKIQQIIVCDDKGNFDDVVLGYDNLDGVINGAFAIGAFVGRYAGRIGNAHFDLSGKSYTLTANDGPHCLHGGLGGTPYQVFDANQIDDSTVQMAYEFSDGEEGFPGRMKLVVTYSVTERNELAVAYEASALDQATVASFTTHAFFNLNGESSGSALNHKLMICADQYFEMTPELIATGAMLPVNDTAFDLREPVLLSTRVRGKVGACDVHPLTNDGKLDGYDDCFLIRRRMPGNGLQLCARLSAPDSGRSMEVWSTEPAMQFYSGVRPD